MTLAARIAALLALILGLVALGWRIHVKADATGYTRAQAEHAAQALAQSEQRREQERTLAKTTQEIDRAHQLDKARLRAAADAAADRLRSFQAAAAASAPTPDPAPTSGAANPFPAIAGECARALTEVGDYASGLAARLAALQDYTGRVCVAGGQ